MLIFLYKINIHFQKNKSRLENVSTFNNSCYLKEYWLNYYFEDTSYQNLDDLLKF